LLILHLNLLQIIMKIWIILIVSLSLLSCQNLTSNKKNNNSNAIDGLTAIKFAEDFVKTQGYTKIPLKKSRFNEIIFESGEYASDTMQILKFRYNMLNPEAKAAKQHGGSWSVGFEYAIEENNIGRAVTMDTLATRILMQPGEVRMDWFYETK